MLLLSDDFLHRVPFQQTIGTTPVLVLSGPRRFNLGARQTYIRERSPTVAGRACSAAFWFDTKRQLPVGARQKLASTQTAGGRARKPSASIRGNVARLRLRQRAFWTSTRFAMCPKRSTMANSRTLFLSQVSCRLVGHERFIRVQTC